MSVGLADPERDLHRAGNRRSGRSQRRLGGAPPRSAQRPGPSDDIAGGAGSESTCDANLERSAMAAFVPACSTGNASRDISVEVSACGSPARSFSHRSAYPNSAHEGGRGRGRAGAASSGVTMVLSSAEELRFERSRTGASSAGSSYWV